MLKKQLQVNEPANEGNCTQLGCPASSLCDSRCFYVSGEISAPGSIRPLKEVLSVPRFNHNLHPTPTPRAPACPFCSFSAAPPSNMLPSQHALLCLSPRRGLSLLCTVVSPAPEESSPQEGHHRRTGAFTGLFASLGHVPEAPVSVPVCICPHHMHVPLCACGHP